MKKCLAISPVSSLLCHLILSFPFIKHTESLNNSHQNKWLQTLSPLCRCSHLNLVSGPYTWTRKPRFYFTPALMELCYSEHTFKFSYASDRIVKCSQRKIVFFFHTLQEGRPLQVKTTDIKYRNSHKPHSTSGPSLMITYQKVCNY